jgi:hypothetical protein
MPVVVASRINDTSAMKRVALRQRLVPFPRKKVNIGLKFLFFHFRFPFILANFVA